ncbi:hypothetical protein ACYOEI_07305 [Singulisphaera rosea]
MKTRSVRLGLILVCASFVGCGGMKEGMPSQVPTEAPKPPEELTRKMEEHKKKMRAARHPSKRGAFPRI